MSSCNCNGYMNRRAGKNEAYEPTKYEHIANIASHAFAVPISLGGMKLLLVKCETPFELHVCYIYGLATIALFTMSTLYHSVFYAHRFEKLRFWLHVVDRATIYIFIASSYYPWLAIRAKGRLAIDMDLMVWFMAILGILYQYNFHEKYKMLETVFYIIMAITPAVAILSIEDFSGIREMIYGGFFYIFGVILFKCDGKIPFAHALWHLHVVIGCSIHYYSVLVNLIGVSPMKFNAQKSFARHSQL